MRDQTFGIPKDVTQKLIGKAQEKIECYRALQPATEDEISYLKSEISAVSSFIDYHKLQTQRETEVRTLLRYEGDYGSSLETPEAMLNAARERLVELESRLSRFTKRSDDLQRKITFLEKDIELLTNMLKSSPRMKISEFAVPPII